MKHTFLLVFLIMTLVSCKQGKKYHDESKVVLDEIVDTTLKGVLGFQEKLNEEFRDPETSPLPDRYRKDFTGLEFLSRIRIILLRQSLYLPRMLYRF